MPTNDSNPTPITTVDPQEHALEDLMPRVVAMDSALVLRETRLDATTAGTIAASAAKMVAPFKAQLVARFGAEAGVRIDELPALARACQQAAIVETVSAAPTDLSAMHAELRAEYDILFNDLAQLVRRKVVPAHELDKARSIQGYAETVQSTFVVVALFERFWSVAKDQTPVKQADLARAKAAAQRMRDAMGDRDQDVKRMPAMEVRLRALTLLIRHYEEMRRELTYLRWYEADVDVLLPSLWTGRGRRARSETNEVTPEDGVLEGAPEGDVVNASGPMAPGTPVNPGGNPLVNG
jgi:hypothetical protein